jgi:ABC-type multidrug transport system ATPase subunit
VLLPSAGSAQVAGFDVVKDYKEIRQRVGYMPGKFSLYEDLSVEENLRVFAAIFETTVEENYHLIEDIYSQLEPFKKRRAGALSGGMKQKLALSCALIHKPEVLFLDEPTTGVDPVSRKEFWEVLQRLRKEGISIVVSTPYMDEAALCDRIALIQEGEILKIDTPQQIVQQYGHFLWAAKSSRMYELLQDLRENNKVAQSFSFGEMHHITISDASYTPMELQQWLEAKGHQEVVVHKIEATIEDCFMALT